MSIKNPISKDSLTPTKSLVKAALYHLGQGSFDLKHLVTVAGVAAGAAAAGAVVAAAAAGAGAGFGAVVAAIGVGTAVGASVVAGPDMMCDATKDHADDISPKLANIFQKTGFHAAYILPLAFTAAAGVFIYHQQLDKLPPAAPQTPVTTEFYKVSGSINNNCQLKRLQGETENDQIFILPKNCQLLSLQAK